MRTVFQEVALRAGPANINFSPPEQALRMRLFVDGVLDWQDELTADTYVWGGCPKQPCTVRIEWDVRAPALGSGGVDGSGL